MLEHSRATKSILMGLAVAVVLLHIMKAVRLAELPVAGHVTASAILASTITFFATKPEEKLDTEEIQQPEVPKK